MSLKIRMIMALVLSAAALGFAAIAAPDYMSAVSAAKAAHSNPPATPPAMMFAALLGLGSWLSVVTVQWRNRQFGWLVASVVLSYISIIAYAIINLHRLGSSSLSPVKAG